MQGASLTIKAKDGTDALGFAVKAGNPLLVDLLLKFGANPSGTSAVATTTATLEAHATRTHTKPHTHTTQIQTGAMHVL